MKFFGQCPVCGAALHLARLSCPGCKAEFPSDEPLSPYERLAPEYAQFLQTFLACRGSMKDVQNELGISSRDLAEKIPGAIYCSTLDKVADTLASLARPGDLILTVGAGDIFRAGEKLLERA